MTLEEKLFFSSNAVWGRRADLDKTKKTSPQKSRTYPDDAFSDKSTY